MVALWFSCICHFICIYPSITLSCSSPPPHTYLLPPIVAAMHYIIHIEGGIERKRDVCASPSFPRHLPKEL